MYRKKGTKIEQSGMCKLCNCVVSPELVAPSLPPSLSPQSQQKFRFAPQTLHYTTLYYTTIHYTILHYTKLYHVHYTNSSNSSGRSTCTNHPMNHQNHSPDIRTSGMYTLRSPPPSS